MVSDHVRAIPFSSREYANYMILKLLASSQEYANKPLYQIFRTVDLTTSFNSFVVIGNDDGILGAAGWGIGGPMDCEDFKGGILHERVFAEGAEGESAFLVYGYAVTKPILTKLYREVRMKLTGKQIFWDRHDGKIRSGQI